MSQSKREVFEQLLDVPLEQRQAELTRLCAGDELLRSEVEQLLQAHQSDSSFLSEPTIDISNDKKSKDEAWQTENIGEYVGAYRLLEQIGEGGFGLVYMAQQEQPIRRRVALKILKAGMDTKQIVARFESERQALAIMDHPNIARVIDAGTTNSGRPFFVMELVRGEPITTFCDHRKLKLEERLSLFHDVCKAIEHAHQKGIVHRDIKPNNILVTIADDKPVVKVIDFGIAKAMHATLTDKTLFTEFRQLIGTPLYMSPEQAERAGVDVDTRTDIYSLGVVLYEMLTGRTPIDPTRFATAGWGEIQKMIVEEEPSRPSANVSSINPSNTEIAKLRSTDVSKYGEILRGDLDWIVLKALDKDRSRRYATASHFAADIERYLKNEPVEATPPTNLYLFSKFVRRNKRIVVPATITFLIMFIATAVSIYSASIAWNARNEAEARSRQATRAAAAAGASYSLPEADARLIAAEWFREIEAQKTSQTMSEQEIVKSETQLIVWFGGWLALHKKSQEANELIETVFRRAKEKLGTSDPTLLALCNLKIQVNELNEKPADQSIEPFQLLIESMNSVQGEGAALEIIPEYIVFLLRAEQTELGLRELTDYLKTRSENPRQANNAEIYRLRKLVDVLRQKGSSIEAQHLTQTEQLLVAATSSSSNIASASDQELKSDLEKLQGRWSHQMWRGGKVVERMEVEFRGTASTTEWLDENGKVIRGREGTFELSRSGGTKILTTYLGGERGDGGSFIYQIQGNEFTIVSGMLVDRNGLPEREMRKFQRKK